MIRLNSAKQARELAGCIPQWAVTRMEQFEGTDGRYDPEIHGIIIVLEPGGDDITAIPEIGEHGLLDVIGNEERGYESIEVLIGEDGKRVFEMVIAIDADKAIAIIIPDLPDLDPRLRQTLEAETGSKDAAGPAASNEHRKPLAVFQHSCAFPLAAGLIALLNAEIENTGVDLQQGVILNFRDPSYSPETGGYHPVEIAIDRKGIILYITDFAYVGRAHFAELAKEIDFDFGHEAFQHFGREFTLPHGRKLFQLWQRNFVSYYRSGVYTVASEPL